MQVRVIFEDGSWGFVVDYKLNNFIETGKVSAFFCPLVYEWVNVGHEFCENCQIKHRAPAGDYHTCFFNREHKCEDDYGNT